MSEVEEVENAPALEDLFLSREFGRHETTHAPGPHREFERSHSAKAEVAVPLEEVFLAREFGQAGAAAPEDVLFAPEARRPLTPLSLLSAPGGHDTTTHLRRNRVIATASGVAAAVLIAIGLVTNVGKVRGGSGPQEAIQTTPVPTSGITPLTPTSGGPSPSVVTTPGGVGTVNARFAGVTITGPTGGVVTSSSGSTGSSGNGSGGTGGTGTGSGTPPTAPSGTILTPVVSLVGHVVVATGTTVAGASTGLGTTLPPIQPVTNVLGSVGGTVTGLGWGIVKLA